MSATERGAGEGRWGDPGAWRRWLMVYALVAFAFWGMRPLWESTEARYAEAGREMAASGDYLVPRIEGREHLTKPPVAYWVIASGIDLLGANDRGARLGQSAVFLGAMCAVAGLARVWGGARRGARREAGLAGLVFGTSVVPFVAGRFLTTDMTLTALVTLGTLGAWRVWRASDAREASRWRWVFWLSFALAFETKGPPGLLAMGSVAVFALSERLLRRRGRERALVARFGLVRAGPVVAFVVVSLAWYVAISAMRPGAFDYFVRGEVLDRLFRDAGESAGGMRAAVHQRHNGAWIYAATLIGGLFPWVFLWPQMVALSFARVRVGWGAMTPEQRFTLVWCAITLGTLVAASSRMPLYALPVFAPLAVWGARALVARVEREIAQTRWIRWSAAGMLVVGAIVMLVFTVFPERPMWPAPLRRLAPGLVAGAPPSYRAFAREIEALRERSGATGVVAMDGEFPLSVRFYLRGGVRRMSDAERRGEWDERVVIVGRAEPGAGGAPTRAPDAGADLVRHEWRAWVGGRSGGAGAGETP